MERGAEVGWDQVTSFKGVQFHNQVHNRTADHGCLHLLNEVEVSKVNGCGDGLARVDFLLIPEDEGGRDIEMRVVQPIYIVNQVLGISGLLQFEEFGWL
jgi:hypothetical protein